MSVLWHKIIINYVYETLKSSIEYCVIEPLVLLQHDNDITSSLTK